MDILLITVGRPSSLMAQPIAEFEARAARYWKMATAEVKAARASKNRPVGDVLGEEAERIRGVVGAGHEIVVLTRVGDAWSSEQTARYLNRMAVSGGAGVSFVVGGAFGLDARLVHEARHRLSLSSMTLPHDVARLVLAEQLYRAGTIVRGEPYHKGGP